ncbi:MAG TPA: hypothetical protein GXZ74_08995 [Tissierellia bacterium]|nr:hypothetical protein [Tissierellia bacterium]
MRHTYVRIDVDEFHVIQPRQAVMVLTLSPTGEFFLESFISQNRLQVDFFQEIVQGFEQPIDTVVRLLDERGLVYEKIDSLGPIYPKAGSIDVYHVFVAGEVKNRTTRSFVMVNLEMLLKYMEIGVFASQEGKQALLKYLR